MRLEDLVQRLHELGHHDLAEQKRKQLVRHSDCDDLAYLRRVTQRAERDDTTTGNW
jgi:hypothetical protein